MLLVLFFAVASPLLSCGGGGSTEHPGIYRISAPLSAAADGKTISFSEYSGTVYYTTHSPSGGQIHSVDFAGKNSAVFPAAKAAGAFYTLYESVFADDAGCLWYVERSYIGESFKDMTGAVCLLHKARTDGAELLSVDLTEIIKAFPDSTDGIVNLTVYNVGAFMSWGNRLIAVKDGKASFTAAVGGKQYSVITQFSFFSFAAKESLVSETLGKSDRFTAGDYLALAAAHPGRAVFSDINRKQFVIYFENYMSAKFVDKETNEPKFGAEFTDMLDFIMMLPEKSPYDLLNADNDIASRGEVQLMLQNDEALLSAEVISGFESYWKIKAGDFGGDMALPGVPCGDGSAVLLVQNELAISSGSNQKAECAEFIKFCLSRKRQENITGGFPVNIDAFDAVMKKAYKARGADAASTYVVPGGSPVNIGHISREEAENLKEYIEGISSVNRPDITLQQIIAEELSRLIAGGQSIYYVCHRAPEKCGAS